MKKLKRFFSTRASQQRRPILPSSTVTPAASPVVDDNVGVCRLEQVPFDIRHQILLALDTVEDLSALVRASPTYLRQYLPQRRFWLWRCLWLTLGHTLIDAYTVDLSKSRQFRRRRTLEGTLEFIAEYEMRCSITTEELFELPSLEEVASIAHFYTSTIRPLLQEYAAWARGNLPLLRDPPSLSKSEERRIIRGLYRFQLFCNVFGGLPFKSGRIRQNVEGQPRFGLFRSFEPWEIEEVVCINMFVDRKYDVVFDQVQQDFDPDNPKFDPVRNVVTPPGAYRLENEVHREYLRNGITSLGLSQLYAAIKAREHSTLVELVAENITYGDDWINDVVTNWAQEKRRENKHSDRDKAQERRDKLPFIGEEEAAPPLAWVTIWHGTYSNLYGYHVPEPLHTWGYVMWDADRLTRTGSLEVLKQQWDEVYIFPDGAEHDPRDEM